MQYSKTQGLNIHTCKALFSHSECICDTTLFLVCKGRRHSAFTRLVIEMLIVLVCSYYIGRYHHVFSVFQKCFTHQLYSTFRSKVVPSCTTAATWQRKAQCLFITHIKSLYFGINKKSYISTKNVVVPGNVLKHKQACKKNDVSNYWWEAEHMFFVMVLFFLYCIVMVMLLKQRVCFVCSSNMLLCWRCVARREDAPFSSAAWSYH